MKQSFLILTLLIIITSCDFSVNVNTPENNEIDFGKMPEVKASTFNNIQVIDENYCEKYDYSLTRFAIEYPDNVEVKLHEDEFSYMSIKVRENGEIIEEMSIGSTTLNIPMKSKSMELLEMLIPEFEAQIESLTTDFIGKSNFKNKMEYQFNGHADYSDFKEMGYDGKYRMIMMIPFPENNQKLKAVLVSFVANEKSGIKSYKDFQDKGVIAKIWETFRYIE
ncbi:MAG: hypothetical protein COB15_11045 [Flavobacteriales bacterium]|nr:MAG: hypothetical protein COB15_11045 [Flavobacteriales bacterium]